MKSRAPGWSSTYSATAASSPVRCRSSGIQNGFGRNRASATRSESVGRPYLKPKLCSVTLRPARPASANVSVISVASWWMLRSEVSTTMSLASRSSARRARSSLMPSRSVPLPWSGWGRRTDSNRRTRAASVASRKTTRTFTPVRSAWMMSRSSEKKSRPRMSTIAAMRGREAPARSTSSTSGRNICGGRLSTTYQPRSSSALPTVERPAPDMPVTMSISCSCSAVIVSKPPSACRHPSLSGRRSTVGPEVPVHGRGEGRPDALHLGDRRLVGALELRHRTEVLQELLHASRSEPGNLGQHRPDVALTTLPLMRDREPVGLVAHPLEQEQGVAVAREDHRVVGFGGPDLLEPLRDAAQVDALDARLLEGTSGRLDLRLAAVDDEEVRPVGELLPALGCRGIHFARRPRVIRCGAGGRGRPVGLVGTGQVREPPREHLVEGIGVVVRVRDREPAVLVFAGQPVFEHHHGRNDVGAAQV